MDANDGTDNHHHAVIGNSKNFWLYDSRTGFDLTHPPTPESPPTGSLITIQTKTSPITVDPDKTALIIIDMQNFFLSPILGRTRGAGHDAVDRLVQDAVPAAREAGIRVVWVNWGLTEQEVEDAPPSLVRTFGFSGHRGSERVDIDKYGKIKRTAAAKSRVDESKPPFNGIGSDMGNHTDPESGREIKAGRFLMRDQWNSALFPPLDKLYEEGKKLNSKADVWIHKNRMSGMWTGDTALAKFLAQEGLQTLFFTGVNTDQCVGGTFTDCFSRGFDCILLDDGCGTTSPSFAQETVEFNAANTMGFQTTCKAFAEGVNTSAR